MIKEILKPDNLDFYFKSFCLLSKNKWKKKLLIIQKNRYLKLLDLISLIRIIYQKSLHNHFMMQQMKAIMKLKIILLSLSMMMLALARIIMIKIS